MASRQSRMSRRVVLRGLGGVGLALPALEVMLDGRGEALAATGEAIPRRYLVCFGGTALGGDGDPRHDEYVPDTVGRDYDLKTALAPLAAVRDEVSIVSGLEIPTGRGGAVPPGGRRPEFHVSSLSPLFSGVRSPSGTRAGGPTSDQIVASAIAGDTTFKSFNYRVQAAWYLSVAAPHGRDVMSYKTDARGGDPIPVPATVSPRAAFESLFGNFTPPNDPEARARRDMLVRRRQSVLDLVGASMRRLLGSPRIGSADRHRLARHFDEVRELERQISALPPAALGVCGPPAAPGEDPPVGGAQGVDENRKNTYVTNLGYSNEEERARIFCDLIHMAFACDLTRVGTLMITMFQSHLNMYPLTGHRCDCHEVGHNGDPRNKGTRAVSQVVAWHVKHFAYLVGRLRDTPEGAGRLIDNCALLLLHEGGHGLDAATGKQNSTHSTENMACLIAGRAGGLRPGRHVPAPGKHPANVVISAMKAVGVPGERLGEVSGAIPELFS